MRMGLRAVSLLLLSAACGAPELSDTDPLLPTDVVIPGEIPARASNSFSLAAGETAFFRVDAEPTHHTGFKLTFSPENAEPILAIRRWDGNNAVELGSTDAGPGLRVLATFDPSGKRTFWAHVKAGPRSIQGTLAVVHTRFQDGAKCSDDCARLLQLPFPNEENKDGYSLNGPVVFRYQFGRRDLLMFLRHAAQQLARAGKKPFQPQDLSQWNGLTPGSDVGALRHASHKQGKDVDISLYGQDGLAPWRSYCTAQQTSSGRECTTGSVKDFDGHTNAWLYALFFQTGRVTMSFLDRELHATLRSGAQQANADGLVKKALLPLYSDGVHIQHWPNHDNHVHIRVSDAAEQGLTSEDPVPFEAP